MVEEAGLEFKLRKIDETRDSFLDEIKNNDLLSKKYKKTRKYLNHVKHLLTLASTITGCVSISAICFICLCSCWYYEFCSRNKDLRNHFRN